MNRKVILLLFFVVILGLFLRFNDLGSESIWVDEAFTYHYTTLGYEDLFEILIVRDVHPPGFYVLENSFVSVFGTSEFILRFVPAVFGILSVIMMFFFVRSLYGSRVGLLGALFFSLSSVLIYYSQEAKMYSMFMFLFLFCLYFFVKFLKDPSWKVTTLLVVGNALLLYTHVLSYLVIFSEIFVYLVVHYVNRTHLIKWFGCRTDSHKFLFFLLGMFVLYLPWMPIAYKQISWLFTTILPLKFLYKFGFDGFTYLLLFSLFCFVIFVLVMFILLRNNIFLP